MVVYFKARAGRNPVHAITSDNVEDLLGRRPPWFRQGRFRKEERHFAVCPYCETPIQMKGLYKRQEGSPRPYGSHTGKAIDGFPFNGLDLEFCPYKLKGRSLDKQSLKASGPVAEQLINTAISEFDRIVLILRDDFGFRFSNLFAERMLDQWFDSEGFRYIGANLRNLPWMIAYFGPSQSLFGQFVGNNSDLVEQIKKKVPQARISESGKLEKGDSWYALDLQCLHHKVKVGQENSMVHESLILRVQDFTKTNEAAKAPTIYRKMIDFNPERFEALIQTSDERALRNENLLEIARKIATKRRSRWLK